jgi:hypothetical protein
MSTKKGGYKYFYMIPEYVRYRESSTNDDELCNKKKLSNKAIFISHALYELCKQRGERCDSIIGKIKDKARSLDVHDKDSMLFRDILSGEDMVNMHIFRRYYGTGTLLDNELEPPYGLTHDPEIKTIDN